MSRRKMPGGTTAKQEPTGVVTIPELRAGNDAQAHVQEAWERSFMLLLLGPAGTGKSFAPVTLAIRDLMLGRSRKIMLARPIIPIRGSRGIGYYPGSLLDKLGPWLEPMLDPIEAHGLPRSIVEQWMGRQMLELVDLQSIRGRTIRQATMLVDEAQNLNWDEVMCLSTRCADNGRIVCMGDVSQTDLDHVPPIIWAAHELAQIDGIEHVSFYHQTNMRNKRMGRIIRAVKRAQRRAARREEQE